MRFEPSSQFLQERLWLAMRAAVECLVPVNRTHAFVARRYVGYDDDATRERWLARFVAHGRNCPSLRTLDVVFAKELVHLLSVLGDDRSRACHGELSEALATFVLSDHGINSQHFLRIPRLHEDEYRFRYPTRAFELRPLIAFSDDEPDITDAHVGLKGRKRQSLYEGWFEGGRGRHRFMLLEKANKGTGCWNCVAVSIVLGLADEVANRFEAGTYETVRHVGSEFKSDFDGRMTADGDVVDCLLVDTFIVRRMPGAKVRRVNHQGWGTALLFRHMAASIEGRTQVRLLIEPAEPRLETLCHVFAFSKVGGAPVDQADRGIGDEGSVLGLHVGEHAGFERALSTRRG